MGRIGSRQKAAALRAAGSHPGGDQGADGPAILAAGDLGSPGSASDGVVPYLPDSVPRTKAATSSRNCFSTFSFTYTMWPDW
jgi:hypothetical protein